MNPWLLALVCLAAPAAPQKLDSWTYQTAARPLADQYADPGGRLQDGETGRGKTVIWQGGTITLELDLKGLYQLSTLKIHQHRHNLNYKLEHLTVLVQRGGDWSELARVAGFIGPTPTMDFVHEIDLTGVEADRLRLRFAGVGVLSLSEIELQGQRVAAATGGAYAELPFKPLMAPEARQEDVDHDGQPELILENAHVRLVFAPAQGGVCRSLRLKPSGTELVSGRRTGYGLLRDQFWQPKYNFADRFYFHRLEQSPGSASVELWASGVGGMMSFTEIRKKITLERDSGRARVHYTITNDPSSQTDYEYGFWSHNWLGTPATNRYFFPTVDGVQTLAVDPAQPPKEADHWYREPARGWTAVAGATGEGLAMLVPYRYLNLFYAWAGTGALAATHEWRLNLLPIKSGGKLEFEVALVPFSGLPTVTGVVGTVVGSLEAQADGDGGGEPLDLAPGQADARAGDEQAGQGDAVA
ncbi:MAG: hypothetical protein HUU35_17225, partial [Armatimonadetes bacterium]|nr:hypothetical protein [Armatimonadota bacterium]